MPRMVREEDRWPGRELACRSCRILDCATGHPDKGMTSAVGGVLEALDLVESGPLVYGDRPVVECNHGEGIAVRAERR
jgi:hypothetical protein